MSRRALVVTLGRARGALAAVRSLTAAGWTVGVGTPDGGGMVGASRACAARHTVPRPRGDGQDFLAGVQRAVREGGYDVVFGGADDWMAALSWFAADVPARVAHPAPDVVARALDKAELGERARAVGIASPATTTGTTEALASWDGPVVVKCRSHWRPGQREPLRVETRVFASAHDGAARERLRQIEAAGLEAVLQRPVSGGLGALIGLVHDGRLVGRVQQRARTLWPTPSGVSASAETVAVDADLAARAERLLAGLGWTGLVELQFLTGDDGVPHLIDLNGRFYGSMGLADAARPGLADAWARQALGLPVPDLPDAPAGVRFSWGAGDLRRATVERRGGLVRDVAGTLRWAASARTSVWSRRDPAPTWHLVTSRLRPTGRRAVGPGPAVGTGSSRPDAGDPTVGGAVVSDSRVLG
ncbi:ATP-grasp domain-containing protein [Aquipuribacter sp. SD81]|uniref:ATP-grasp domain-containing protein n=1 Tax=Aquipuribacter sp. SD81 TaxID=3127703 RepID=UPI0030196364